MVRLEAIAAELSEEERQAPLAFAECLSARAAEARPPLREFQLAPQPVPGPAGEGVVAAMKRLSAQYPMLDEASRLMGKHVRRGRAAAAVIADWEQLFDHHCQALAQQGCRET